MQVVAAVVEHVGRPVRVGLTCPPRDLFPRAEPLREFAVPGGEEKCLTAQQNAICTQQEFAGYESATQVVGHVVPVGPVATSVYPARGSGGKAARSLMTLASTGSRSRRFLMLTAPSVDLAPEARFPLVADTGHQTLLLDTPEAAGSLVNRLCERSKRGGSTVPGEPPGSRLQWWFLVM